MRYCNKEETVKFTPKLHNVRLSMQQGLNNRFAYLKDDKIFLLATILDPRFKMNFFFDHLQMEKARQYLLLEGLKTGFGGSSDESTHSSPIKKKRPEENPYTHSSFWKCYDEVAAEQKSFDDTGTTSLISTELDAYLKIGRISRCDNPYT
ncbi:zinc finger bed domain-containing protein 4-like protein [Lasius niger]|uniref:Zinc finger bed domain-containing protein 4-like protein n=1 Tax=Lasius niger TaxID=67767 RepID=A0A0J7K881_LASNI|nr:zinc finger bed domain-containing protein 4-like protein [Lasius niger]